MSHYMDLEYSIETALFELKTILDKERNPVSFSDVSHKYEDKYDLANWLATSSANSLILSLEKLGLTENLLIKLKQISDDEKSSVFLHFDNKEKWEFLREEVKNIESDIESVLEGNIGSWSPFKVTSKTVTKVNHYYWEFMANWKISVTTGSFNQALSERKIQEEVMVVGESCSPRDSYEYPTLSLCLDWLFDLLSFQGDFSKATVTFEINRNKDADCRTPRRNKEIEKALDFFDNDLKQWCKDLDNYMEELLQFELEMQGHHNKTKNRIYKILKEEEAFIPVFPLMETTFDENGQEKASIFGTVKADMEQMLSLQESQLKNLLKKATTITKEEETEKKKTKAGLNIISEMENEVMILTHHMARISSSFRHSTQLIEKMLETQLVNALGKTVSTQDFDDYMDYHHDKIFQSEYRPKRFCYSIRRPGHNPEGTLSIEQKMENSIELSPIVTSVRVETETAPLNFPVAAATTVSLNGPRYLHSSVQHSFNGSKRQLSLNVRARQFSSFILMIGTLSGPNSFEPQQAIIIKNKDDLKIPLLLETMPTAQEFKDAIESLSPEQQRFAKQFRSKQLAGTLFAVVIIQIKPQLEKLLNLTPNTLTKEIKLTQDLMDLFIDYQIPSDLISFDKDFVVLDDINASSLSDNNYCQTELSQVKHHVAKMKAMVTEIKSDSVEEARQIKALEEEEQRKIRALKEETLKRRQRKQEESYEKIRKINETIKELQMQNCIASVLERSERLDSLEYKSDSLRCTSKTLTLASAHPSFLSRAVSSAASMLPSSSALAVPSPKAPNPPTIKKVQKSEEAKIDMELDEAENDGMEEDTIDFESQEGGEAEEQEKTSKEERGEENNMRKTREVSKIDDFKDDFTRLPKILERKYDGLEERDVKLRPTTIKISSPWKKEEFKSLLSKKSNITLEPDLQKTEKNKAFDLLDALSKSGDLSIDCSELHVVFAATHCFERTIIDTVIQGNQNPIEKIEMAILTMAATIHGKEISEIANESALKRAHDVAE